LTIGGGPFAYEIYTLVSECVNGYQGFARVKAKGLSLGRGITFAGSGVTLDDHLSNVDPLVFNGDYFKVSAGVAGGIGYGFNLIILGGAESPGAWSPQAGIDVSAGITGGKAEVEWSKVERCNCK